MRARLPHENESAQVTLRCEVTVVGVQPHGGVVEIVTTAGKHDHSQRRHSPADHEMEIHWW